MKPNEPDWGFGRDTDCLRMLLLMVFWSAAYCV